MILFIFTTFNAAGFNDNKNNFRILVFNSSLDDELDQEQNEISGSRYFGEHFFCAQSFTPSLGVLTRVKLLLFRQNNPPDDIEIIVRIRGSLDGDDLAIIKIKPIDIQGEYFWLEFDFPDITIPPGEHRFIIGNYSVDRHDIANCYRWCYQVNNPYSLGETWHFSYEEGWESFEDNRDFCFRTYGRNADNVPPYKPIIEGPINGKISTNYNYSITTTDYDNDQISYYIDWGDGSNSGWIGLYESGDSCETSHIWNKEGYYEVKAKAKDESGKISVWSDPLSVSMPKKKSISFIPKILLWLFEHFPFLQPYLSHFFL
jgi:hypothetical protein